MPNVNLHIPLIRLDKIAKERERERERESLRTILKIGRLLMLEF